MSEIYHHGIKGMKWGVRRTPEQLGHRISKRINQHQKKKRHSGRSLQTSVKTDLI